MALQDRERGERIAQLREERAHMTQQELAQAMGIALRTVQKWEAGFGIQAANKRALAETLNATLDEIMGTTEPVNPFSVIAEIDARVQEFRRYSDQMRAGFEAVAHKLDHQAEKLDRQYLILSEILAAVTTPEGARVMASGARQLAALAAEEEAGPGAPQVERRARDRRRQAG